MCNCACCNTPEVCWGILTHFNPTYLQIIIMNSVIQYALMNIQAKSVVYVPYDHDHKWVCYACVLSISFIAAMQTFDAW